MAVRVRGRLSTIPDDPRERHHESIVSLLALLAMDEGTRERVADELGQRPFQYGCDRVVMWAVGREPTGCTWETIDDTLRMIRQRSRMHLASKTSKAWESN